MYEGQTRSACVNGTLHALPTDLSRRLSDFLRIDLRLTGTKIGCGQGDCGSCAVLVDGEVVQACLTPVGKVQDAKIVTVEGLSQAVPCGQPLQTAFRDHQAVQCGFCTPGFLITAAGLLDARPSPTGQEIREALSGVLCRCTGYKKIIEAVESVARVITLDQVAAPASGRAVGAPIARLDGAGKIDGTQNFGADGIPFDALMIRAVRSPFDRASFAFGDIAAYRRDNPGLVRILTARDVPGRNLHGVHGAFADQPIFAEAETRFRGEAVAAIVGEREAIAALDIDAFPIAWMPLPPVLGIAAATAADAPRLHETRRDNILIEGHVERGEVLRAIAGSAHVVEGQFVTQFVEHAYLEPEAGWAVRDGCTIAIHSCTQAPHAHRGDLALILDIPAEDVWVVPSAVGGGFGGKLDLTVQPFVAVAAWLLDRPVGMVYSRAESIATSTKRHPARIVSRIAADADGCITGIDFTGDFDTGAYASWGTAVASRVPVHATGPYHVPHYRARTRAIHTNVTPAGAFRGFGVPQTAFAQEQMIDALARRLGIDQLEFRLRNALVPGQAIATGQVLADSVGITACLEALRPRWRAAHEEAARINASAGQVRRGVGLAATMYGCGNTAMSNPSTIRIGVRADSTVVLHQGAVDAGQGSNTVIPQIAADALGIEVDRLVVLGAATNITPDCGRTSASRQTFVTGKAAEIAGRSLRRQILRCSNAGPDGDIRFEAGAITIHEGSEISRLDLASMVENALGYVLMAEETFDPPTTGLGPKGQGSPYAVYAFGAQLAELDVDLGLGTVSIRRFTAAHDVGRIVNPTLLSGQIEGAIAQGIGMALMERFEPGHSDNLHDYLLPTLRDMPPIETIFCEATAAIGPFGAKGIGEPSLVPTAAAIANAIYDATGSRVHQLPATPEVILQRSGDSPAYASDDCSNTYASEQICVPGAQ